MPRRSLLIYTAKQELGDSMKSRIEGMMGDNVQIAIVGKKWGLPGLRNRWEEEAKEEEWPWRGQINRHIVIYMTSCIIDKRVISCREWSSLAIISRLLWHAAICSTLAMKTNVYCLFVFNPKDLLYKLQRTDPYVWDKVKSCPCSVICDMYLLKQDASGTELLYQFCLTCSFSHMRIFPSKNKIEKFYFWL